MKSILLSVNPKWCYEIINRRKTVEIRKTRPKEDAPFKVYIYCTKGTKDDLLKINSWFANGKIIGEFICDGIKEYETEFYAGDDVYQDIREVWDSYIECEKDYRIVTSNERDDSNNCNLCKDSCLSFDDIKKYVGLGDGSFYGWHISKLVIYDEPRVLYRFHVVRAPQSWCYIKK